MALGSLILFSLAVFYSLISFTAILLILVAGIAPGVLPGLYYFILDTTGIDVPSELQDATLLREIGEASGIDLVGSSSSAADLGMADEYKITLLSACGTYPGDRVECIGRHLGYAFDPSQFSLDSFTSGDLSSYAWLSKYLAAAYVISAIFVFLAPFPACFAGRWPGGATIGASLASLATVFLFTASVAAAVVFPKTEKNYKENLEEIGIQISGGNKLVIVSFVAFAFALLCAVVLFMRASSAKKNLGRGQMSAAAVGGSSGRGLSGLKGGVSGLKGFLINKGDDSKGLISGQVSPAGFTRIKDPAGSDDGVEMDPVRPKWRGSDTKDKNAAYEPYSSQA